MGDPRPLSGAWQGWTQFGGGSSYHVRNADNSIVLYYDIAGAAIGMARSTAASSRPWTVQVDGRRLMTPAMRNRVFGSKDTARKAAEDARNAG